MRIWHLKDGQDLHIDLGATIKHLNFGVHQECPKENGCLFHLVVHLLYVIEPLGDSSNVSPATARAGQLPPTASRAAKNTASGIADHDGFIDVEVQDESSSPRVHAFGFVRGRQEVPLFKSDRRAD